jgi:hypothetical protein
LEGRLKNPFFCKNILVSKFIREWKRELFIELKIGEEKS